MKVIVLLAVLLSVVFGVQAACDQKVNPGADLASLIASAATGSTICLNAGDYGTLTLSDVGRTGFVTVQATSGTNATVRPRLSNCDFIRFQSLTLNDMLISACCTNIQVVGNIWEEDTNGIFVFDSGCSNTNKKILIDSNQFVNTAPAWSEGKIGLVGVNGVIFSNNLIQGQSVGNGGDGIQTGGTLANIVIGPGNIFRNILQAPCDSTPGVPHCDSIQFVGDCPTCTINGNWFDNVEVVLQHHDAVVPVAFTNNLVTTASQMWVYSTPGNASYSVIEHNTFYNLGLAMWGTTGSGVSDTKHLIAENNIIIGSSGEPSTCTSSCTFTTNLCQTSSQCAFSSSSTVVTANTPLIFLGGAVGSINSWAGWQLATSSVGHAQGNDGLDIGITYYGPNASTPATATPTHAPTTLPTGATSSSSGTTTATPKPTTTPTPRPTTTPTPTPKPIESLYAPYTLVPATIADSSSVNVGVQFSVNATGRVLGCAVFSHSGGCGANPDSCDLWNSAGAQLAHTVFSCNAAGAGWLFINFTTPVVISANTQYTVSSLFPTGSYSGANNKFTTPRKVGHITVPVNGGVYTYNSIPTSPTQTYLASEYFVTPLFLAL